MAGQSGRIDAIVQLELLSCAGDPLAGHNNDGQQEVHAGHLPWVLLHYFVNFIIAQLGSQLFYLKDDVISFLPSYR